MRFSGADWYICPGCEVTHDIIPVPTRVIYTLVHPCCGMEAKWLDWILVRGQLKREF